MELQQLQNKVEELEKEILDNRWATNRKLWKRAIGTYGLAMLAVLMVYGAVLSVCIVVLGLAAVFE